MQITGAKEYDCLNSERQENNYSGTNILNNRNDALFSKSNTNYYTRIMPTLPPETEEDYELIKDLMSSGMNCTYINYAHDHESDWGHMPSFINKEKIETETECTTFMDLGGMKIHAGELSK